MPFIVSDTGDVINEITVPGGWAIMADSGIMEAVPGEQGPMATVKFKVYDANSRYLFAQQLLGQWTGKSAADIAYIGPFAYPPSPNLVCTQINAIESLGPLRPMALHLPGGGTLNVPVPWIFGSYAVVTATFTRPPYQPATTGGYFTIEFAGQGQTILLPKTCYFWGSTGQVASANIGVHLLGAEITVTRYRMPFIPDIYMIALAGCVNQYPFQIGNVMYPAGTLLFAPGNSLTESDPLGNITYKCQYKFLYKTPGWNYFINPSTGQWDTISNGQQPLYNPADFSTLP